MLHRPCLLHIGELLARAVELDHVALGEAAHLTHGGAQPAVRLALVQQPERHSRGQRAVLVFDARGVWNEVHLHGLALWV